MNELALNEKRQEVATSVESDILAGLTGKTQNVYCSLTGQDFETKAKVMHIAQNPDKQIAKMVGEVIMMTDVYVEVATLATGEKVPRVILIDEKGKSYQATSFGVLHSLEKLFGIFGMPHYEVPIPVVPCETKSKNGTVLFLDVKA